MPTRLHEKNKADYARKKSRLARVCSFTELHVHAGLDASDYQNG